MKGRIEGRDLEGEEDMTRLRRCHLNQIQKIQFTPQELKKDTPVLKNAGVTQTRKALQSNAKNATNLLIMTPTNEIIYNHIQL